MTKPRGPIYDHIHSVKKDEKILLYRKFCTKSSSYSKDVFKKTGSSTSNQMKHVKNDPKT